MRKLLGRRGWAVCKLRSVCVQLVLLSPWTRSAHKDVCLSRGVYARFIPYFTSPFSTSIFYSLSPLLFVFYPASTRPTKATTSFLNLIKPIAAVKELAT